MLEPGEQYLRHEVGGGSEHNRETARLGKNTVIIYEETDLFFSHLLI